jgi:O-antigen/teichoic acid export membrane protein
VDIGTLLSSQKVYLEVLPLAPVIIVAYIFHGISSLYNRGIYYKKKNQWLALIIIISGALNVLLNIYFINRYGFEAAAYTTMASYFVMMVLSILLTTFVLKLPPLPLGRILKYIVLLAIIISMNYIFGAPNVALSPFWILYKGALFALLGAGLFYNKIGIFFNK